MSFVGGSKGVLIGLGEVLDEHVHSACLSQVVLFGVLSYGEV